MYKHTRFQSIDCIDVAKHRENRLGTFKRVLYVYTLVFPFIILVHWTRSGIRGLARTSNEHLVVQYLCAHRFASAKFGLNEREKGACTYYTSISDTVV